MAKTRKPKATPAATPAAPAPGKGPGVIARLVHHLQNGGGTVAELFERLKADFPDRGDGMLTTVKIQVKRLHQTGKLAVTTEHVEGRGTVYKAEAPAEG